MGNSEVVSEVFSIAGATPHYWTYDYDRDVWEKWEPGGEWFEKSNRSPITLRHSLLDTESILWTPLDSGFSRNDGIGPSKYGGLTGERLPEKWIAVQGLSGEEAEKYRQEKPRQIELWLEYRYGIGEKAEET